MKFGVPNGTRLGRPEAGGRGQGCEQIGMVGGREYQGSGFFQHSIFFRSPLAPGVARRRSSASRPVAHLLLCTLPVPLAIFSGFRIPSPFHALTLPGQDWTRVCCLGMCLAEPGPIGLGLATFHRETLKDVRPEGVLSERGWWLLPLLEPGSNFWTLWGHLSDLWFFPVPHPTALL